MIGKIYKTFQDWCQDCRVFNSQYKRDLKLWEDAQSFPNDKIRRARSVIKSGVMIGDTKYAYNLAIKILDEK
jgi:hypothetical protein